MAESPLRAFGIELGRRMTVVRLSGGGLLIHSPAELDAALRDQLNALGEVRFVVSASSLHGHVHMGQYRAAYPRAELFAAPMLAGRRRDLLFDGFLSDAADARWSHDLDQELFLGNRFIEEVAFLHRSSRSLIVGDLCLNVSPDAPLVARLWALGPRMRRRPGPTPAFRAATGNRRQARRSIDRILEWDFDRLIVGHGEVIESGGRQALREAYAWL